MKLDATSAMTSLPLSAQRGLAVDSKSLDDLSSLAGRDSQAAIKETAKQFEALFMRELLKSMREATSKSGLIDNEQTDLGSQLLDEQWAVKMTGLPGGLGEMIERQLTQITKGQVNAGAMGAPSAPGAAAPAAPAALNTPNALQQHAVPQPSAAQAKFVSQHQQAALQAQREFGIPAGFMIGQAAHETGWGRSEIRKADGGNSFNLFGIKAGPSWKGQVAEVTTTEYVDGQARKVSESFRAYESYADAFGDYARLISQSPRYAQVMNNLGSAQSFATHLQSAGYATDPNYANKLSQVINTTLQVKRALG